MEIMKVNAIHDFEVDEVELPFGKITSHQKGNVIRITTPEFRIIISKKMVNLGWVVHRPSHDHNNMPYVVLRLPEGGRVVEWKKLPELHLHPDGYMPRCLRHGTFVEDVDLYMVNGVRCKYKNGKWVKETEE